MTKNPRTIPGPKDRPNMVRRPELNLKYGLVRRICDRLSGHTDGRHDTTGARTGAELTDKTSMWLARSTATLAERVEHEHLVHQAVIADASTRRGTVQAEIATTSTQLATARAHADGLASDPPDLDRRGLAEGGIPVEHIHSRRRREYNATVTAPARKKVADLTAVLEQLGREKNELDAQIATVEQVTETRIARLSEFYARRGHTYRRAYLRVANRTTRGGTLTPIRTIRQEKTP